MMRKNESQSTLGLNLKNSNCRTDFYFYAEFEKFIGTL